MRVEKGKKANQLFDEYLNFVSSSAESETFLKENGLDPDQLVNESLRKIKQKQMIIASMKTEAYHEQLRESLLEKVRIEVERLLNETGFNLETFIKKENITLAYRNFDKMSEQEIKAFLERHYLLKFEKEAEKKTE